ncbi:enoyl-CoA hydratase/isomerase family protein [Mangrovibacillus cuniculi]|uniref:Enoyl-CoA hydratase/isomerase family protein n=1 Tax=Mangrovibacillus cuniculi TaxID=2593652 RepID=A0A7S8CA61_9BACI|nr:enoyl-CoA hydratase/isomerase family protein [Mangrovibacillus cuniculi]QPC46240.1 enoyl-CoA hydratase/isomerase family protein [Mangrovibacillus cuniculi]
MDYRVELQDDIYTFTINRPNKRNAISLSVLQGLKQTIAEIKSTPTVKMLIIKGEGEDAFCSGGDVEYFHQFAKGEEIKPIFLEAAAILFDLATCPILTIADLEGHTLGGGAELAAACDLRILRKGSKVAWIQGRIGISTGWGGANLLFERVNKPYAMKWLTSTKVITEEDLIHSGFIQHIYEDSKERNEIIANYKQQHVEVIRSYKATLVDGLHSHLVVNMKKEVERCSMLWENPTHMEAVEHFLSKKQ